MTAPFDISFAGALGAPAFTAFGAASFLGAAAFAAGLAVVDFLAGFTVLVSLFLVGTKAVTPYQIFPQCAPARLAQFTD